MQVKLETERLLLRPVNLDDTPGFFTLDSDPEVHRYLGNQPVSTIEQSAAMIQGILDQYEQNGIGRLAIIEKKSGNFVGWSGLKYEEAIRDYGYYDLGYRLIRSFWGQGYATEAAIASLKWGYEEQGYADIYAAADVANIASNRILSKLGTHQETFQFEGIDCQWYRMNPVR